MEKKKFYIYLNYLRIVLIMLMLNIYLIFMMLVLIKK